VPKIRDKAVCVVSAEEVDAWQRQGIEPDCREHRHVTENDARLYVQPPRTMTDEEEERFFQTASSRSEWELVYCFALLSVNIGAAGSEMRGLRIGDVDLMNQRITIRRDSAKNKYRVRKIPLVAGAAWAAQKLVEIAATKGATSPHHYLFPFRLAPNRWDPS